MTDAKAKITNEMFEEFKDHRARVNESNLMRYTIRFRRPQEKNINDGAKIAYLNQYISKEKGMTISDYMHGLLEADMKKQIKEHKLDIDKMVEEEYSGKIVREEKKAKKEITLTLVPGNKEEYEGVSKTKWKIKK